MFTGARLTFFALWSALSCQRPSVPLAWLLCLVLSPPSWCQLFVSANDKNSGDLILVPLVIPKQGEIFVSQVFLAHNGNGCISSIPCQSLPVWILQCSIFYGLAFLYQILINLFHALAPSSFIQRPPLESFARMVGQWDNMKCWDAGKIVGKWREFAEMESGIVNCIHLSALKTMRQWKFMWPSWSECWPWSLKGRRGLWKIGWPFKQPVYASVLPRIQCQAVLVGIYKLQWRVGWWQDDLMNITFF